MEKDAQELGVDEILFQREETKGIIKEDTKAEVWAKGTETLVGWNEQENVEREGLKWKISKWNYTRLTVFE